MSREKDQINLIVKVLVSIIAVFLLTMATLSPVFIILGVLWIVGSIRTYNLKAKEYESQLMKKTINELNTKPHTTESLLEEIAMLKEKRVDTDELYQAYLSSRKETHSLSDENLALREKVDELTKQTVLLDLENDHYKRQEPLVSERSPASYVLANKLGRQGVIRK